MWKKMHSAQFMRDDKDPSKVAVFADGKELPIGSDLGAGKTVEIIEIVPNQTVVTEEGEGVAYAELSPSDLFKELTVGETYTVNFNGTEYKCVAWEHADWEGVVIGNGNLVDAEGKGEDVPFACDSYSEDKNIYINIAMPETCTISITGPVTTYTHIDPNYLPMGEVFGKVFLVEVESGEDEKPIFSKTHDEMLDLVKKGYTLYLKDLNAGGGAPPVPMTYANGLYIEFVRFEPRFGDEPIIGMTIYRSSSQSSLSTIMTGELVANR